MILLSIRDIIEQIAQKYGLDTWDWIALSITLTTLVVSSVSLVVACKTLKSQKQTEKNTYPDINPNIQLSLVQPFISGFLSSAYHLFALYYILNKTNFKTRPSHQIWNLFVNPKDYLFERVFYSDINNFQRFKSFIGYCEDFNKDIDCLKKLFDEEAAEEEIKTEFMFLFHSIILISDQSLQLLRNSFSLTESQLIFFFKGSFDIENVLSEEIIHWIEYNEFKDYDFVEKQLEILNPKTSFEKDINNVLKEYIDLFTKQVSRILLCCTKIFGNQDYYNEDFYTNHLLILSESLRLSLLRHIENDCLPSVLYKGKPFTAYILSDNDSISDDNHGYCYILRDINE